MNPQQIDQAPAHAELGASSAHRWMECPGSVRMCRGLPSAETEYTREGTAAHLLGSRSLEKGVEPDLFIGTSLLGVAVTDEMAEAVRVYTDYTRGLMEKAERFWVEKRFSLAALQPPASMFGTSDFGAVMARLLEVVDYKHGTGYSVDVVGNVQLRYYALGMLLHLEASEGPGLVDRVRITIIQPRAPHSGGIIRSEEFTVEELVEFAGELLLAADAALQPDAPLQPGPHCRFCNAAATCSALKEHSLSMAMVEFPSYDTPPVVPEPETLPMETILNIMQHASLVEHFLSSVRRYVQAKLERGEPVQGYKLVEKRAVRKWLDSEATQRWLEEHGIAPSQYLTHDMKSVAQIEKIVGKQALPADLWTKQGGTAVAPDYDARPALPPPAESEFSEVALTEEEQHNG